MQKSIIAGPFRAQPPSRSGYVTFRHPNGKWYQRRILNRGNDPQPGGQRSRYRIKVGVIK